MPFDRSPRRIEAPLTQAQRNATGDVCPNAARRPIAFVPDRIQAQILASPAKRLLLCCSRQWGKSTVIAAKAIQFAIANPNAHILIASASLAA